MSEIGKNINIIAFDIPYPPDYGGAIDVYFKIKAFYNQGINVYLHCYQYGREKSNELENLCASVNYYPRHTNKSLLFNNLPYIVISRQSEQIVDNLLQNNFPILFEGLHTCLYLNDKRINNRKRVVRTHNIEHEYYAALADVEKNIFRKYYFSNEANKLKKYENILKSSTAIAAISDNDTKYFKSINKNTKKISAFHPNDNVEINEGFGTYVLYHGSLSVGENNQAALFIVNNIFDDINDIPLIIAGNHPSKELKKAIEKKNNVKLIENISAEEIYELIKQAHINILPTFQATGIKLKLLNALYKGKHCIVNDSMIINTGLENLCIIKNSINEIKQAINQYFKIPFRQEDINKRKMILDNQFSMNIILNFF
jgi:glycosyltransferase involved in cell wall biosynthesis